MILALLQFTGKIVREKVRERERERGERDRERLSFPSREQLYFLFPAIHGCDTVRIGTHEGVILDTCTICELTLVFLLQFSTSHHNRLRFIYFSYIR